MAHFIPRGFVKVNGEWERESERDMTTKHAEVSLDMDENRTVWQVMVFDEDDNLLEMRPFRDKEDADEYAKFYNVMDAVEGRDARYDCDDSDDGYALASAGFGTDEDYGGYDEY